MKKIKTFTLLETQKNISLATFFGRWIKGEGTPTCHSEECEARRENPVIFSGLPRAKALAMTRGFTLAETLIVLVILGIIASITIPVLVNRHRENANRTKIRKSMTAYEAALSKMVIENNIKSDNGIDTFAGENCANSRPYFKSTQNGVNNCSFRTSDNIWWNISDIKNPVISLKDEVPEVTNDILNTAKDTSDNIIYAMRGWFDDNGSLRIDDLAQATGDDEKYLTKLYNFANGIKPISLEEKVDIATSKYCSCTGNNCCSSKCGKEACIQKDLECENVNVNQCPNATFSCSFKQNDGCLSIFFSGNRDNNNDWKIQISDDTIYAKHTISNMTSVCKKQSNGTLYCQYSTPGTGLGLNGITYDKDGKPISYYNYDRGTCSKTACSWPDNRNPFKLNLDLSYGADFSKFPVNAYDDNSVIAVEYKIAMEYLMK